MKDYNDYKDRLHRLKQKSSFLSASAKGRIRLRRIILFPKSVSRYSAGFVLWRIIINIGDPDIYQGEFVDFANELILETTDLNLPRLSLGI